MIREATPADIPRIIEMGRNFLLSGPYREIIADNPEVPLELAKKLVTNPQARILVEEQEGKLVGVFCFILFPHYYSGLMTAGELIWYVEPEARKTMAGLRLKWEAETLAKKLGAVQMHLTCPIDQDELFSKLSGYKKVETGYQRTL
ncbi:hypothetical protein LCGC14_0466620 [marine sediment metagenome]|uniref:N-acetyltransferase domain-containing protein n=1 Tax=marine sediment metagenome TaxID=412755 RepID=A0A0F9SW95_9ZZZZ